MIEATNSNKIQFYPRKSLSMQQVSDAQIKGSNYTFQYSSFNIPHFLFNLKNLITEHRMRSLI